MGNNSSNNASWFPLITSGGVVRSFTFEVLLTLPPAHGYGSIDSQHKRGGSCLSTIVYILWNLGLRTQKWQAGAHIDALTGQFTRPEGKAILVRDLIR